LDRLRADGIGLQAIELGSTLQLDGMIALDFDDLLSGERDVARRRVVSRQLEFLALPDDGGLIAANPGGAMGKTRLELLDTRRRRHGTGGLQTGIGHAAELLLPMGRLTVLGQDAIVRRGPTAGALRPCWRSARPTAAPALGGRRHHVDGAPHPFDRELVTAGS
jgi:hypothetical protein